MRDISRWKKRVLAVALAFGVSVQGVGSLGVQVFADTVVSQRAQVSCNCGCKKSAEQKTAAGVQTQDQAVIGVQTQDQTQETIAGVLICANCNMASPSRHPVNCTLMDSCAASGYGILVPTEEKTYLFYGLDEQGNAKAKELLLQLKAQGVKNNLTVTVTGKVTKEYAEVPSGKSVSVPVITDITEIRYDETHASFQKNAKSLTEASIHVAALEPQSYTGQAIKPSLTITDGETPLKVNFDYQVEYENNTEVGNAQIRVTGIGAFYKDTITVPFQITGAGVQSEEQKPSGEPSQQPTSEPTQQPSNDPSGEPSQQPSGEPSQHPSSEPSVQPAQKQTALSDKNIKISAIKNQNYTSRQIRPTLQIKDGTKTLTEGKDYRVTYGKNTAVGPGSVSIRGIGAYTGTIKKTFRIVPRPVAWKASRKQGVVNLRWSKRAKEEVSGYQIQYAAKHLFAGAKTVIIKKAGQLRSTIKVNAKKTYYFRVRAYKTVGKKSYTSTWKSGKITTKK